MLNLNRYIFKNAFPPPALYAMRNACILLRWKSGHGFVTNTLRETKHGDGYSKSDKLGAK
jgi:hypothetical protein